MYPFTIKLLQSIKTPAKCITTSVASFDKIQFPRRTVMYVPCADERKLSKIPSLNADTVVLDFEDGVAFNQKQTARSNVLKGLKIASECKSEKVVRINGIDADMLANDLNSLYGDVNNFAIIDGLMLPKCDKTEHLKLLDFAIGYHGGISLQHPVPLYIIIESSIALKDVMSICNYGVNKLNHLKLEVVIFGSDDYLASIGGQRTDNAYELVYARQTLVSAVKAFGLQAIDIVNTDFKDIDNLMRQSLEGARMGFTGKQVIHPAQIDVVKQAFTPSPELLEWAKGLILSFKEHEISGKGAFLYKDKMIDRPLLLQAQNIIKMSGN